MLCLNYDLKKCKLIVFVLLEYEPLFDMVYELLCSMNVFIRHGMLIIVLHIVRCLVNISLHNSIFNAKRNKMRIKYSRLHNNSITMHIIKHSKYI